MIRNTNTAGRVNLTKYVNLGSGKWRFCPAAQSPNGRVRPDYVIVDGKTELHKEGAYYIDWYQNGKRRRESVGKNAADAFAAAARQTQLLKNQALGIHVVSDDKNGTVTLAEACSEFLDEIRQQKRPKTYAQYKTALDYFQKSCANKPLAHIERKDLIRFMGFLSEQGLVSRTRWNKVQVVITMLKANGIRGLIRMRDWPKYTEAEPEVFSSEELEKFLASCDPWKRVLFEFFWMTGFREAEVQHVTWSDIDFQNQVVRVTAKPGFTPKTWEEREVPIPDRLLASLRRQRAVVKSTCPLVFATKQLPGSTQLSAAMQKHRPPRWVELWNMRHRPRSLLKASVLSEVVSA